MTEFASHPTDSTARFTAHSASVAGLTDHYEEIVSSDDSVYARYGGLQSLCSRAIARMELLDARIESLLSDPRRLASIVSVLDAETERVRAADEQRARVQLAPRSGQVDNVVPIRSRKDAPAPLLRPGA